MYDLEKDMNGINAYKELCNSNIIRLDTDVNEESARHVCTLLTIMDDINESYIDADGNECYKPIWLYINSPGGVVYDGMAIIDTMRSIKSPVFTVCCGMAMSMGAAILSCGDRRYITEHSTVMLHEVSSGTKGKVATMKEDLEEGLRLNDVLEKLIAENCGKTQKEYHKATYKLDLYLDAESAIEFGIVDAVLPRKAKVIDKKYFSVGE